MKTIFQCTLLTGLAAAGMGGMLISINPAFSSPYAPSENCRRVQFQQGATSAVVTGNVASNDVNCYVLRAARGQNMSVNITSPRSDVLLSITGADGQPYKRTVDDSPSWTGTLPATQDYYLKAVSVGEGTRYNMRIVISPLSAR